MRRPARGVGGSVTVSQAPSQKMKVFEEKKTRCARACQCFETVKIAVSHISGWDMWLRGEASGLMEHI